MRSNTHVLNMTNSSQKALTLENLDWSHFSEQLRSNLLPTNKKIMRANISTGRMYYILEDSELINFF